MVFIRADEGSNNEKSTLLLWSQETAMRPRICAYQGRMMSLTINERILLKKKTRATLCLAHRKVPTRQKEAPSSLRRPLIRAEAVSHQDLTSVDVHLEQSEATLALKGCLVRAEEGSNGP